MDELWYLDGSAGCDLCKSSSSYSFTLPADPHPNCNCAREEIEVEEPLINCEFEIRNATYDIPILYPTGFTITLDQCHRLEPEELSIPMLVEDPAEAEDVDEFDEGLRDAVIAEGWQEPDLENDTVDITLEGGAIWDVTVETLRHVQDFSGELWVVCQIDDTIVERQVTTLTGHFERLIAVSIDGDPVEFPCPGSVPA